MSTTEIGGQLDIFTELASLAAALDDSIVGDGEQM